MFFEVIFDLILTGVFAVVSLAFFSFIFPGPMGFRTTNVWIGMATSYVFWFMCTMTLWGIGVLEAGQMTYDPISTNGYKWASQLIVYILVYYYVDKRIKNSNHGK